MHHSCKKLYKFLYGYHSIPSCRRLQFDTTRRMNDKKQEATHTNTKINRKEERKNSYFFKNVYFFFRLTYFEISSRSFLAFIVHSSDDNK